MTFADKTDDQASLETVHFFAAYLNQVFCDPFAERFYLQIILSKDTQPLQNMRLSSFGLLANPAWPHREDISTAAQYSLAKVFFDGGNHMNLLRNASVGMLRLSQ